MQRRFRRNTAVVNGRDDVFKQSLKNNHREIQGMNVKKNVSLLSAAIGVSILASTACCSAYAADFRTTKTPVKGQYIVVLKQSAARLSGESGRAARVSVAAKDIASTHRATLMRSFDHALRGFVVKADDAALTTLLADPRVAYVEEDGYVSINSSQSGATWGLDRVDQRALPLNGIYNYNMTATGVHAYIIDTGVLLAHSQFSGRIGNGFDAITAGGSANDCNGHGTHVAGTVGGTTWGVAKAVTIHPVRVFDCTGTAGTSSSIVAGMDWVVANRVLPAVANMSLGGAASSAIDTAVENLTGAGVTVVVAAGNINTNACNYSPARAPAAITVGSTTSTDARSSFSNYGTCLDIFAPGSSITSSWSTSPTATNTISGTSMASPHVAGAAALYLAVNPSATPAQVTNAIINNSTQNRVTNPGAGSPNRLLYSLAGPTAAHTGPWYNPAESGWGLTWFEYPNNGFFGLMFVYGSTGRADWYEFAGSWTATDVHSGDMRQNNGPAFGQTFDPALVTKTVVGNYTLTFSSATTATLTVTINGITRSGIPLSKL
ncbi:MAG: S8 family peptidase [Lysobacteraceae bacterium]